MILSLPVPEFKTNIEAEYWTTSKLEDEFFLDLAKARCEIKIFYEDDAISGRTFHYRKYYRQALQKMYRIPLTEQNPKSEKEAVAFTIDFKDLSSRVQSEFLEYCKLYSNTNVTLFLKEIVMRLFENIDYRYAHMSVMKKLRVKLNGI
jgi:hypothetical protein